MLNFRHHQGGKKDLRTLPFYNPVFENNGTLPKKIKDTTNFKKKQTYTILNHGTI